MAKDKATDPKDERIAELEAEVAELHAHIASLPEASTLAEARAEGIRAAIAAARQAE